jgi:hypothetical protein
MASNSIAMRLYFERPLYEAARIIGYAGIEPFAFWDRAKELGLVEEIGKQKLLNAVYDLTRADRRETSPPRYELTAPARKACFQLLGAPPEHEMHDFIKHGPPNVIGEENARRWQEQYRKRQQAEADQTAEGEAQAEPEKRTRKPRGRGGRS